NGRRTVSSICRKSTPLPPRSHSPEVLTTIIRSRAQTAQSTSCSTSGQALEIIVRQGSSSGSAETLYLLECAPRHLIQIQTDSGSTAPTSINTTKGTTIVGPSN